MYLATKKKVCDDRRAAWAMMAGFKNSHDIFVQHRIVLAVVLLLLVR